MTNRRTGIAVVTAALLTLALPALGHAVGIYKLNWTVAGQAYVVASGACGHLGAGETDPTLLFCFGDSVALRSGGSERPGNEGEVAMVDLWIHNRETGERWTAQRPRVKFSVNPLLESARIRGSTGCGPIDLRLTAVDEPRLSVRPVVPPIHSHPGEIGILAYGSSNVGRRASVAGELCGVSSADGPSGGEILRSVGSEGVFAHVQWT